MLREEFIVPDGVIISRRSPTDGAPLIFGIVLMLCVLMAFFL